MKKIIKIITLIAVISLCCCGCRLKNYETVLNNTPYVQSVPPRDTTEKYVVKRVVDGDTFIVLDNSNEIRVRMIGIDTPESVSTDESKNCEYGKFVSEFTKTQLEGKSVELEYDTDKTDIYGRTLDYVYINNEMFNCTLIEKGYAVAKEYYPNIKYSDKFSSAQIKAQQNKVGMWSDNITEKECNLKTDYFIEY